MNDAIGAVKQAVDLGADGVLEGGLIEALLLRLAGHDQAAGIGDGCFQRPGRQKKMIEVSRMAKISARNATATMPIPHRCDADCCRTKRRARRTDLSRRTPRCKFGPHITDPGYERSIGGNCTATADQYLKGVCEMLFQSPTGTGLD